MTPLTDRQRRHDAWRKAVDAGTETPLSLARIYRRWSLRTIQAGIAESRMRLAAAPVDPDVDEWSEPGR